jgi:hypothetical protein
VYGLADDFHRNVLLGIGRRGLFGNWNVNGQDAFGVSGLDVLLSYSSFSS